MQVWVGCGANTQVLAKLQDYAESVLWQKFHLEDWKTEREGHFHLYGEFKNCDAAISQPSFNVESVRISLGFSVLDSEARQLSMVKELYSYCILTLKRELN